MQAFELASDEEPETCPIDLAIFCVWGWLLRLILRKWDQPAMQIILRQLCALASGIRARLPKLRERMDVRNLSSSLNLLGDSIIYIEYPIDYSGESG